MNYTVKLRNRLWLFKLDREGSAGRHFRELAAAREWDAARLRADREERLKGLLRHCLRHVPYYQPLLTTSGWNGCGNTAPAGLAALPLLRKDILKRQFDNLRSSDLARRKWYLKTSGGSTGKPAVFIQDEYYQQWNRALAMLQDHLTGYCPGESKVVLWGSERDLFQERENFRVRLGRRLRNETWLNAYRMSPEAMAAYIRKINRIRPKQILAYVESLVELCRFSRRTGRPIRSPRNAVVTAGVLTPAARDLMEETLQAPVFNQYGSREVGIIAKECSQKGLHLNVLTHFVEITGTGGEVLSPGETGDIVVTLLTNYAMPLLRYRIGDRGSFAAGPCSCGCSWPRLAAVEGRVTDNFITAGGTMIYGALFRHFLFFQEWIKKYQIVQEDYLRIRYLIVPWDDGGVPSAARQRDLEEIAGLTRRVMGVDCRVDFDFVEEIEPSPSGKHHYTISRIGGR